mmetsp:Transcript_63510/g.127557  ORF Transcript_63510/g.127557 Transcript_63510/m.127557 type:complete len:419 (+) Transcript_63510:862-2118(+)
MRVPHLLRHVARNLIGAHGHLEHVFFEPKVRPHEHQGQRDAEPQQNERAQSTERHRRGGAFVEEQKVEGDEHHKHDGGKQRGGEEGVSLPLFAPKQLVEAGRVVARKRAHEHKEQQNRRQQTPAVGGAQKAENREPHGHQSHHEDLHPRPREHAEEHGAGLRRSEHVAVHQLPPRLFLGFFERLHLVVGGDVFAQGAEHDHGHHPRQEEHDHERVHDAEVVDFVVGVALEVHVPAVRPRDVRRHPLHVVAVHHLVRLLHRLEVPRVVLRGVHLVARRKRGGVLVEVFQPVPHVVDGEWDDLESDDACAVESSRVFMVLEHDAHVVVQKVHLAPPLKRGRGHEPNREPARHVVVLFVAHGARETVDDPVDAVLVVDDGAEQAHVRLVVVLLAQNLAPVGNLHLEFVQRALDSVAFEDFA